MKDDLARRCSFYNFHRTNRRIGRKAPYQMVCWWFEKQPGKKESATKFLNGDDAKDLLKKRALILNGAISEAALAIASLPALQIAADTPPQAMSTRDSELSAARIASHSLPQAESQETPFGAPPVIQTQDKFRVVMAPVGGFARWDKARVHRDGAQITLRRGNFSAQFTRGSQAAIINGKAVTMGAACEMYNGVLYTPPGNLTNGVGAEAKLSAGNTAVELKLDDERTTLPLK